MRGARASTVATFALCAYLSPTTGLAGAFEERSPAARALYTTGAVVANVVPIASAVVAPQCLPGYILCKLWLAGFSIVAAGEQLVLSGGANTDQARAILYRGFNGDWILTGAHVAGDAKPTPWPQPVPPAHDATKGGFEPPPL
jgi:hypothetical protein